MKRAYIVGILISMLVSLRVYAEDIDLFVGVPPDVDGKANVLIILDNTANWNNAFENEVEALRNVFYNIRTCFWQTVPGPDRADGRGRQAPGSHRTCT